MRASISTAASLALVGMQLAPLPALADEFVRCESEDFRYTTCRLNDHGYVSLDRQLSRADCIQGRTWDYDRREIWVDDGCGAEFRVETRHHTSHDNDHHKNNAAAAAAAIALIAVAAAASSSSKAKDTGKNDDTRYSDTNYGRGGHSSYVPNWMVGRYQGYNLEQHVPVSLEIKNDGRATAEVQDTELSGYVNDERLYIGDYEFDIEREGDGFNLIQVGNRHNQVHYTRK